MAREGSSPSVPTNWTADRSPSPPPPPLVPTPSLPADGNGQDPATGGSRGRDRRALLGLLALALLPRLIILLAPHAEWSVHGEEYHRANVAWELLNGSTLSLIDYQYAPFFGGSLVTSVLATPLFALLGVKMVVLKLVPVLTHLVAVGLLFCILRRWVSRRSAWIAGLLFALGSPGYTYLTTIAWGSHLESNALGLGCLWLMLDLHERERQLGRRLLLGFLGGFSLYFGLQCALFLLALLIVDGLNDRGVFRRREFAAQVAGFGLGFSPWLIYNLKNSFSGMVLYDQSLAQHIDSGGPTFGRLGQIVSQALPGSLAFADLGPLPGRGLELAVYALLLVAFGAGVNSWRGGNRPRPCTMAIIYAVTFLLAYSLSDFPIASGGEIIYEYRYVGLLWPWALILVAVGAERILEARPRWSTAGRGILGAILGISLLGSATSFADLDRFGTELDRPAIGLIGHGKWYAWRCCNKPELRERVLEGVNARPPQVRREIFRGMGRILRDLSQYEEADMPAPYTRGKQTLEWFRERVPEKYRNLFKGRVPLGTEPPAAAEPGDGDSPPQ
ncbi:MAG: hypothetical protein CMJ98_13325 [Planctomycetes bacterium]|nr:hypothetical protein [Planctomycetota bacterium]MBV21874.1 hypothetical protein [Planctomycetaceae bacterium]